MTDLWQPVELSLRIAVCATALAMLLAVPLAFLMARRNVPGKSALEAIITLPLVLPPTVVGYLIIQTLGARGWIGHWLSDSLNYSILFRFEGAVLAATVVALPLLYLPAKAAFAAIDREHEDNARLCGANARQTFFYVCLPMARRGIASGCVLAFARALGEFGATVMVFGWQPGKITLPISVWSAYEQGEMHRAAGAVVVLSAISLALVALYNRSSAGRQD